MCNFFVVVSTKPSFLFCSLSGNTGKHPSQIHSHPHTELPMYFFCMELFDLVWKLLSGIPISSNPCLIRARPKSTVSLVLSKDSNLSACVPVQCIQPKSVKLDLHKVGSMFCFLGAWSRTSWCIRLRQCKNTSEGRNCSTELMYRFCVWKVRFLE